MQFLRAALICARSHWEKEKMSKQQKSLKFHLESRHAKTDGLQSLDAGENPISERYLRLLGGNPATQMGEEDYHTNLVLW